MLKSVLSISSFTLLSRFFGFLRDMAQASLLGTSPLTDAVTVAIRVPALLRKLFAEGAFDASFVPAFSRVYKSKGAQEAQYFSGQILTLLFTTVRSLVSLMESMMPS